MIYIRKGPPSTEVSQEINRVKRDFDWSHVAKDDQNKARTAFDQLDKKMIRDQLFREQKSLCVYCMRKLKNDESASIEHWIPISSDATKALDYSNMMLCCDGGRSSAVMPRVLCCDAAKADRVISISPYKEEQMERIKYRSSGEIVIVPQDKELEHDINQVLKLNGDMDEKGNMVSDTSSGLVYGRKQVYRNYERFISGLGKKGKPIGSTIRKRIEEMCQKDEYDEFAGVWLYFLRRKLRSS